MQLGQVQMPEQVLSSHEDGRLVLFTGAGISYDPPSNLPTFAGLCRRIVDRLQKPIDPHAPEWRSRLDTLLGELDEDPEIDVHGLARQIVTSDTSPNDNHDAIVRIAARSTARIVSTNYDLHLSTAAKQRGIELPAYEAPALPLGDAFSGLVYLHGSARGSADRLVLTDRDFGQAYLRAAWATRFLEPMFAQHTVLFVGYSHADPVMRYLGLALSRETSRFALTDRPDDPEWKRLGITPIGYPVVGSTHRALTDSLTAWADLTEMGLLDHRQRIRALVQEEGTLTPQEESYLESSLCRAERVGFFCDAATSLFWLRWAEQRQVLKALFDPSAPSTDVARSLSWWYASKFAVEEREKSDEAWELLAGAGGQLSDVLWEALASALHSASKPRASHFSRWLRLLMWQDRNKARPAYLEYALRQTDATGEADVALELFAHLASPLPVARPGYGLLRPSVEVRTRGSEYWLTESWNTVIEPIMTRRTREVFSLLEATLTAHYMQQMAFDGPDSDRLSWRRSAIQATGHGHRDPLDPVIDAARDTLVHLQQTRRAHAHEVIREWLASPHALFRRLAIYACTVDSTMQPDDKLDFLTSNGLHHDIAAHQEVFHLLRTVAPGISEPALSHFLAQFRAEGMTDREQWALFQLLSWLRQHGAGSPQIAALLGEIQATYPDFAVSERPHLTHWVEVGSARGTPPLSTTEFHDRVATDPADAVAYVASFKPVTFPVAGESSLEDAVGMLADVVRSYPEDGLLLWPHTSEQTGLRDAIIKAWAYTDDASTQEQIILRLLEADLSLHLQALTQFLMTANRDTPERWVDAPRVEELIVALWSASDAAEFADSFEHWIARVINHPVGCLVDFWFQRFRFLWGREPGGWTSLRPADEEFLRTALEDPHVARRRVAVTQIAAMTHALHTVDREWTRSNLLPLAHWASTDSAIPFWWGMLAFGRWSQSLLDDGLLPDLVETASHLELFGEDEGRRWASLMASIALTADSAHSRGWVYQLTVVAPAAPRTRWLEEVSSQFDELPSEARVEAWSSWLKDYWRARNHADPIVLTPDEATALASLVPWLPPSAMEDAVALVEGSRAHLGGGLEWRNELPADFRSQPAHTLGRYFTHLMRNTATPFHGGHWLGPLLSELIKGPGDWTSLREAALALGLALD